MDTSRLLMVGMLLLGFSMAGGFLIMMTLGAIRRLRELPPARTPDDVTARLARIESAVESIRTDVDRLVEHQRLAAPNGAPRLSGRADPSRVITPH